MLLKISYEADLRASVKSAVAINVDLDACFASGNPEAMLPPREKS